MPTMNNVQLLGKVTIAPKQRQLKNGSRVAELGMGIPESYKNEKGEWTSRMHFVDVVLWDQQAVYAGDNLRKGDGALIQGTLQFDQWENKEGEKRSKLRVKGLRIQSIQLPAPQKKPSS